MSTSITETVNSALASHGLGSYASQARPVVDALNAREAAMADQLIGFATQQGLSEADATAALRQVGMSMREPAPGTIGSADAQNFEASGDLAAVLNRIDATLNGLVGFARENGFRG